MAKVEKHREEVVVNSGWRIWGGVGSWRTERAGMETKVKESEREGVSSGEKDLSMSRFL